MLTKRSTERLKIILTFDSAIDESRLDVEKYLSTNDQKYAPLKEAETPIEWEVQRLSRRAWDHVGSRPEGYRTREAVRFGLVGVQNFQHEGQNVVLKFKQYDLEGGQVRGLDEVSMDAVCDTPAIREELGIRIAGMSTLLDPAFPTSG